MHSNLEWLNQNETKLLDDEWVSGDINGFRTSGEEETNTESFRSLLISGIQIKSATIKSVSISIKAIYVITSDKQVLRWLTNEGDTIKLAKREAMNELIIRGGSSSHQRPEQVFCEPTGWHCIVTFNTEIAHYFHINASMSLFLNKIPQQHTITSVGWSRTPEKYNTKEILLGTSKGIILELIIEYDPASDTIKHSCTVIFSVGNPIYGIQYLIFPGVPSKLSVIVACPKHLYQFIGDPNEFGRPNFTETFKKYKDNPNKLQRSVHEFPGDISKSHLQLYYQNFRPESFAWMNAVGLFFGRLPSTSAEEIYVGQMKPVQYPKGINSLIGIGMTSYHLYFLCPTSLLVVSKISLQVVHTIEFEKRQGYEMIGLVFDEQTHSFFTWSQKFVYQIIVEHEEKDVWKYYIEQLLFDEAIKFCETTGSSSLLKVRSLYGDYLLSQNKKIEAAENYAQSLNPFESTVLRLMDDTNALQRYLEVKLDSLSADMNTQKTLLSTWLVEIYLDNINQTYMMNDDSVTEAENKLQRFLESHKTDLDEETTCYLLQSHGRIEDWVFFADLMNKHEMVMLHHINQQEIKKALLKLDQIDINGRENLLYKFAPIFMKYEPMKTVKIFIDLAKAKKGSIDVKKLLPALMNVDQKSRKEAIKFETFLINDLKFKDKSLHNLFIFHLSESEGEKQLTDYLKRQENMQELNFDTEYALSVFKQNEKIESQIALYSMLKMHSEAVTLAIENKKLDLAKQNARKPEKSDEELSRKLWLQIAIYHIKDSNVRDALNVMNESKLIKMEDLLPYFDENDSISNFKEDICKALDGYKQKIGELNEELKESTNSAHQVKDELKVVKGGYIVIESVQICEICNKPVIKGSFYVYPCTHCYHKQCLIDLLTQSLREKDPYRASKIERLLEIMSGKEDKTVKKGKRNEEIKENPKELQERLDNLLAPLCYYCSPQFIESIKDNLIEDSQENMLWNILDN